MTPISIFSYRIIVPQSAIDDYGHVNNVVYLQWMQDLALRHPQSIPEYQLPENTGWFAREHRIEYHAPAYLGDEIEARTWISEIKRVRGQRKYEFCRVADGKIVVSGETQWVFVELTSGRPVSIPPAIQALFLAPAE